MKRVYLIRTLFVVILAIAIGYMSLKAISEEIPESTNDNLATSIAKQIEAATGKADFDNFRYLRWSTIRNHSFVWDKTQKQVIVHFSDYKVLLNLDHLDSSRVFEEEHLTDNKKVAIIQKAYSHFCNDSFWLIAPYKLFDEGVQRTLVKRGSKNQLMITFASGGVTPGDSYLWYLDDNHLPTGVQMWTQKIPVDGIYITWENFKVVSGTSQIALDHKFGPINIKIENLEAGNSMHDLKLDKDPFLSF